MKESNITEHTLGVIPFRTPLPPSDSWVVFSSPLKDFVSVQSEDGRIITYLPVTKSTFENVKNSILHLVSEHNKTLKR